MVKLHILMWQFWDRTQYPTLTQGHLEKEEYTAHSMLLHNATETEKDLTMLDLRQLTPSAFTPSTGTGEGFWSYINSSQPALRTIILGTVPGDINIQCCYYYGYY